MPMQGNVLKKKFQKTIEAGLKKEFAGVVAAHGFAAEAEEFWVKLAKAIAPIALDAVEHIQLNAEVLPGIASTPAATTGTGKVA